MYFLLSDVNVPWDFYRAQICVFEYAVIITRVQIISAYFAAIITESGKIWACAGTCLGAGTPRVRFCIGLPGSIEYRRVPASTGLMTSTVEQNPARNWQKVAFRMSKSEGDLRSDHGQYFHVVLWGHVVIHARSRSDHWGHTDVTGCMHASVCVHKSRIGHFEYVWPLDRSGSALAFYRTKSFLNLS